MPSPIPLDASKRCTAIKDDGERCGGIRLRSGDLCLAHSDRNPEKVRQARHKAQAADVSRDLDALMDLDPTLADNLQRIRIGLMRHVAAGSIEHQAASACLRFAQAAYDARASDRGASSMSAKLRAQLLSRDDPAPEQPEGGGGGESRAGRDQ